MKIKTYIDFETRSCSDLKTVGAWLYSEHPTTDINCICFIAPDGTQHTITRGDLDRKVFSSFGWVLFLLASNPDCIFVAHNAEFEQAIWQNVMVKKYGFPAIPSHRWSDTMAKAYYYALPGSLDMAARSLKLSNYKHVDGKGNMLKLAKPRRITKTNANKFWEPEDLPEAFEHLYSYCAQDVRVLKELDEALPELPKIERRMWEIDQEINQNGLYIDRDLAQKGVEFIEIEKARLFKRFCEITQTSLRPTQREKMKAWFLEQGFELPNTQKATLQAVATNDDVPEAVVLAIEMMASANKASLAKYPAFVNRSRGDGLLRGAFQIYGAKRTKRWAGRGAQFQNLPRPSCDSDLVARLMLDLDYEEFGMIYGDINTALSTGLRACVIAGPGEDLIAADYAQFENRVAAWLAGAKWKLDNYRAGIDPYKISASNIYGVPVDAVTDDQRFVGKVGELSLQYQGGIRAYAKMGKGYGLSLRPVYPIIMETATEYEVEYSDFCYRMYLDAHKESGSLEKPISMEEAFAANIIKMRWRAAHPEIVNAWEDYFNAACMATLSENGKIYAAGARDAQVQFFRHSINKQPFLVCKLPDGTPLFYFRPKVEISKRGKMRMSYVGDKGREGSYGGKFFENVTQGVQRMGIRDGMMDLWDAGYKICLHVHDEPVSRVPEGKGCTEEYAALMCKGRKWSRNIPINAKAERMKRYKK